MSPFVLAGSFAALFSMLWACTGLSATRTPSTSGVWSDASVWNGATIPSQGDDVIIPAGIYFVLDLETPTLNSVRLETGAQLGIGTGVLRVRDLVVDGDLSGGSGKLYVSGALGGRGTWDPGFSQFILDGTATQVLGLAPFTLFFDLALSDSSRGGVRRISGPITTLNDLDADLAATPSATLEGPGDINVAGSFRYVGGPAPDLTGVIHLIPHSSLKYTRLSVKRAAGVTSRFYFPRIAIEKADTSQSVGLDSDTLELEGAALGGFDTVIEVRSGTFDLERGLLGVGPAKTLSAGPFLRVAEGAKIRASATLPVDSLSFPYLLLDSGSTFEYAQWTPTDLSWFVNTIVGNGYRTLLLSGSTTYGATYADLVIEDALIIRHSSTLNFGYGEGPHRNTSITLRGDLINLNRGAAGSAGFGDDGDGMVASSETWIIDKSGDTVQWIGPGELANLYVAEGARLSVRYAGIESHDSILITGSLKEADSVCGGGVLGKVVTLAYNFTTQTAAESDFQGIGVTIRGGTPMLGATRVTRVAGYRPPGLFKGSGPGGVVTRYFQVWPQFGPQSSPNELTMRFSCDDLAGVEIARLRPWRSTNGGRSWSIVSDASVSIDEKRRTVTWQSINIGSSTLPHLYTLSDVEVDVPLPVLLESLRARRKGEKIDVEWHLGGREELLGFELELFDLEEKVGKASWVSDKRLEYRQSSSGEIEMPNVPGSDRIAIYAVSMDGNRSLLGSTVITESSFTDPDFEISVNVVASEPILRVVTNNSAQLHYRIVDALGRQLDSGQLSIPSGTSSFNLRLGSQGAYVIEAFMHGQRRILKSISVGPN